MTDSVNTKRNPWSWVPSLYLASGFPYTIVMTVSVIMYKKMGVSNTDIALYTSWLYLPWVIKPLWSPVVDILKSKRYWIVLMQFIIGASLACVAFALPLPSFFQITLAFLWLLAFSGATQDIAADGFYMIALDQGTQAQFLGLRVTFYRIAMVTGQGLLVVMVGRLEKIFGIPFSWSAYFFLVAVIFISLSLYHRLILPRTETESNGKNGTPGVFLKEFISTFTAFFSKNRIGIILLFLLVFRINESQLLKMVSPFLLDPRSDGGLGLSTDKVGFAYGTVGIIALLAGGITGGMAIARHGLRYWLLPMALIMHIAEIVFILLSVFQPEGLIIVSGAVGFEMFTYGFSNAAYMMFMIMVSEGEYKTAHYAICTGFMALGMMIPGMASGALQEMLGYRSFFLAVLLTALPALIITLNVKVGRDFGKKKQ